MLISCELPTDSSKPDEQDNNDFVAVTAITGTLPTISPNTPVNLNGSVTVVPADATNKTITWSITNLPICGLAEDADVADGIFTPTAAGEIQVTATIVGGKAEDEDFVRSDFTVIVTTDFVAVTAITGTLPSSVLAGDEVDLNSDVTVEPAEASNKTIIWSIENPSVFGLTADEVADGVFTPVAAGEMQVTATVVGGRAGGENFTCAFTITVVEEVEPAVNITSTETTIMEKGGTRQFSATVVGLDIETVEWTVEGGSDEDGTDISASGLLTIGADEANITLTVKATSTENPALFGTTTVKVKGWMEVASITEIFSSASSNVIRGVAYGGNTWVAVGVIDSKATIAYSSDGETWTKVESPTEEGLSAVIYDGPETAKNFIVIGEKGTILYSNDGITWTPATVNHDQRTAINITGVTYGNDQYLAMHNAVGNNASATGSVIGGVLKSTDGITWESVAITGNNLGDLYNQIGNPKVTFGNGMFIAFLQTNNRIIKSADGTNWALVAATGPERTGYTQELNGTIRSITFAENKFIALEDYGTLIMSDETAASWTVTSFGTDLVNPVYGYGFEAPLVYANGKYVAMAPVSANNDPGSKLMYHSTPLGVSGWTLIDVASIFTSPLNSQYLGIHDIAYGDGKFMAVSAFGKMVITHEETLE
jgi:hypothetical protein